MPVLESVELDKHSAEKALQTAQDPALIRFDEILRRGYGFSENLAVSQRF